MQISELGEMNGGSYKLGSFYIFNLYVFISRVL